MGSVSRVEDSGALVCSMKFWDPTSVLGGNESLNHTRLIKNLLPDVETKFKWEAREGVESFILAICLSRHSGLIVLENG